MAYLFAFLAYSMSAKAAKCGNAQQYFRWHTCWHFGLILAQSLTSFSR
jgi:hypothetical protein